MYQEKRYYSLKASRLSTPKIMIKSRLPAKPLPVGAVAFFYSLECGNVAQSNLHKIIQFAASSLYPTAKVSYVADVCP